MLVVGHQLADDDEVVGHELRMAVNEGLVLFEVYIRVVSIFTIVHPVPKQAVNIKMGM